jgi:hypothetical protein
MERIRDVVMKNDIRTKILNLVEDCVSDLLYYDRKNSEYVTLKEMNKAIKKDGKVLLEDMVYKFRECLEPNFEA